MGRLEPQRGLIVGVVLFVAVALVLHLLIGVATWPAIVIPALVLGVLEGVAQRGRS
jgi:hypothetical protein